MMRTLESLFVVIIVFATLTTVFNRGVLPAPIETSSTGLQGLADSAIATLDKEGYLTQSIFEKDPVLSDVKWKSVVETIDSALPLGTVFQLKVYRIDEDPATGIINYTPLRTAGNAESGLPPGSITTSYTITNPDVTVTKIPETITPTRSITLYILDIQEAKGWWITGYDGHTLAQTVKEAMNPYFKLIVMINNMTDYEKLLNGQKITTSTFEDIHNAIVVNPFGETIPIPTNISWAQDQFTFKLGGIVNTYNWTWVSLVGYPFYYLTNTVRYNGINDQNGWGIYGMVQLEPKGYDGFLYGIDNPSISFGSITLSNTFQASSPGVIFSGEKQTATRAFSLSYLSPHNIQLGKNCFSGKYYSPSITGTGTWATPDGAYSNDGVTYAQTSINNANQIFYGYGLNIGTSETVKQLQVRIDAWSSLAGKKIKLEVSSDAGLNWLPKTSTITLAKTESSYWVDITSWDTWTYTKVNGNNLRIRVTGLSDGETIKLDWVPVEITTSSSIIAGAIYDHIPTSGEPSFNSAPGAKQKIQGSLIQIGLARTPDARVMQILLLARYQPKIQRTQFDAQGTTRLITLQVGQVGTN
jgi:hypothetical protein